MVGIDGVHESQLDLNLLVALDVLLQEASVTRAAQRLGLTQSAMSHKLRRLRDAFDDPLLVGGRHGMMATPRAEEVAVPIRRALLELKAALRSAEPFDPAKSTRRFTVASSDYAEFEILPRVLERLTSEAPGVDVVMVSERRDIHRHLENGSVDLVVGPELGEMAGLIQRRVASEEFVCLVRKDHPRVGATLDLETYLSLRHVVVSPTGEPGGLIGEALAARGLTRRVVMQVPHFMGGPFIVARSDLVMTAPRALAEQAAKTLAVRIVAPPLDLPPAHAIMTWHERFQRDPAHRYLREIAAEATLSVIGNVASGPSED